MQVLVKAKILGLFTTEWEGEGRIIFPEKIDFTQTAGLFRGLKAIWSFDESRGNTIVTIATTFSKPHMFKFVESLLGRYVVEKTTKKRRPKV